MHRSNTHDSHVLLSMAWQSLDKRKFLVILTMRQVIKTLEREGRISQDVIKNNLDQMHPIG